MNGNPYGLHYDYLSVTTPRLTLRMPQATDCANWIRIRARNYEHLQSKEPIWDMDHLTYIGYYRFLNETRYGFNSGNYYGFMIVENKTRRIVGHIEVANILPWPKRCATIGYWMAKEVNNRGYMTEAVGAASQWALKTLDLIRVDAGTLPENEASQKVLLKSGFIPEGYVRNYGEVNGRIVDHYMFSLTI